VTISGGLRARFIQDSIRVQIIGALMDLGWFYDGRRHAPIRYRAKPADWDETVESNTLSITLEDFSDSPSEIGDGTTDDLRTFWVDLFAENDSVGHHLIGDIRDIVAGRFPSIGRTGPVFDIYDLRQATPASFVQVDVERVMSDRVEKQPRPWQQFWHFVRFDILDDHSDEYDGATVENITEWTSDLADAYDLVQAGLSG